MFRKLVQVDRISGRKRQKRTDAALIAQSQLHDFADLSLMLRNVLRTNAEGAAVGRLIKIRAVARVEISERLNFPRLSGKPGEHAALDV